MHNLVIIHSLSTWALRAHSVPGTVLGIGALQYQRGPVLLEFT